MKTGCEVPSAKSLTAKCAVKHVFASFGHQGALWEIAFDACPCSQAYRDSRQIIVFLKKETAFTLQNKQNKLYLKSGAHRAARGTAHAVVSTALIKDVTLTANK